MSHSNQCVASVTLPWRCYTSTTLSWAESCDGGIVVPYSVVFRIQVVYDMAQDKLIVAFNDDDIRLGGKLGKGQSVAVAPAVAPIVPDGVTAASLTDAPPVVLDGTMAAHLAALSRFALTCSRIFAPTLSSFTLPVV